MKNLFENFCNKKTNQLKFDVRLKVTNRMLWCPGKNQWDVQTLLK